MSDSVELVLLECLKCGMQVNAEDDEVAWMCATCGQGLQLTDDGLAPLTVYWAAARHGSGAGRVRWQPFWVFMGSVTFQKRETYSGRAQPDPLWDRPRGFFVPAFTLTLAQFETLGAQFTRQQPALKPGPPTGELRGCTLQSEDARRAAEFVVLSIEAARKDKLRSLQFQLNLNKPELWMLPFLEGSIQFAGA